MKEYYSEAVLAMGEKSLNLIRPFAESARITLIGGMAVSKWAPSAARSHDPDILVDLNGLAVLSANFNLDRNPRLGKFEIKVAGGADVDVYAVNISRLGGVDLSAAFRRSVKTADGFRVVAWEDLMRLKTSVFLQRKPTPKGRKDAGDLLALLKHKPETAGIPLEIRPALRALLDDSAYLKQISHIPSQELARIRKASAPHLRDDAPYEEPPDDPDLVPGP